MFCENFLTILNSYERKREGFIFAYILFVIYIYIHKMYYFDDSVYMCHTTTILWYNIQIHDDMI